MRFLTRKRQGTFAHAEGVRWGRRAAALGAVLIAGMGGCSSGDDDAGGQAEDCTKKCAAANGQHFVCRKSDQACVSLLSEHCTEVFGDDTTDDAVILGAMFTTT